MKKQYLLFAFVLCLILTYEGFGQNFDWIYSTANYGVSRTVTCDSNGNVYMAGEFATSATFGDTIVTGPTNSLNIFFTKMNSDGDFLWVKNIGDIQNEICFEVACDEFNDVYITGMFAGTVSFEDSVFTSVGFYDIFLAKYNTDGDFIWAIQAGGESFFDHALTLDFDSENNVYITGCFENTATFGDTVVASGVPSGGNINVEWGAEIFIAKYSLNGEFIWVKHVPGSHHTNRGHCIAITSDNEIFISGKFEGDLYLGNDTISSYGAFDAFHLLLDSDGNTIWASNAGSAIDDKPSPSGIAIDDNDNIYVTGFFQDVADFNGTQITSNGSFDIYLAKYNPSGNLVWIRNDGGGSDERAYGLAICETKLLISGYMSGNSLYNNEVMLTSNGLKDVLVACYDTDGDFYWANNHGGFEDDWAFHITSDNQDSYYITGYHNNHAIFGDTILNIDTFQNIFVAKFTDSTVITRQQGIFGLKNEALFYPNPTAGIIYIPNNLMDYNNLVIKVFNVSGELVSSEKLQQNKRFDLHHLGPGIYIIQFVNSEINKQDKLIVY